MLDTSKVAIRASTQEHLDIEDVQDDIVVLKDGSCCLVITTTAINFGLLSEKEQEATIYAYAGLLNSLTFSIQIVVRSQRKDVSSYLRLLDEAEKKADRKLIREQIQKYRQFIQETVQKNEVLDKKFYIVVPMSALELGAAKTLTATLKSGRELPFAKDYVLQKAKVNLYPKRDHLLRLLSRLGLKGRQLATSELIQLFFNTYNPETSGQQAVETKQYTTPLVKATMESALPPHRQVAEEATPNQQSKIEPLAPEKPEAEPSDPTRPAPITIENQTLVQSANQRTDNPKKETNFQDQIGNLVKESVNSNLAPSR